ncbi:MAG: UDP-N-acetylmuramate--L-alanine ligase [bacterium]
MFGKVKKLYFVGIGGAGMSGIAEILYNLGYQVAGSDQSPSDITRYLQSLGVPIHAEHSGQQVHEADVVVISSAVGEDNPEVIAARQCGIPVIKRAEMLGELMRLKYSIGVSGTHGKTTTTSMIGMILQHGGYQPTLIVGGIVAELGTGASLGKGDYLVAEADEYDRSFLSMYPAMAVVTNLESDHMDCYADMDDLMNSFMKYMNQVPFYGAVVLSADDSRLMALRPRLTRRSVTFGFSEEADYRAIAPTGQSSRSIFSVFHREELLGEIRLRVPGRHNVANAMAAVAACRELDVPFAAIAEGLQSFRGVGRRFEVIGEVNGVTVIDDYAHHPTEITATLSAAREVYSGRIIVIYQPHLFSRTRDFQVEFARALATADVCLLVDIYPAREKPIEGITSEVIMRQAHQQGGGDFRYLGAMEKAPVEAARIARPGDTIITMGAGTITRIKQRLLMELTQV